MADYPTDLEAEDWKEFQEEQKDRQEEFWEEQDEFTNPSASNDGFPNKGKPESLFTLFKDVWKTKDSTKVANLDPKTELGDLGLSVRHIQKISYVANILGEKDVKGYFDELGEVTLATSMSKRGWFAELFVSTKKFAQKSSNIQNLQGTEKKSKWRLFGGGKKETATEEQ